MPAEITVERIEEGKFGVTIIEEGAKTSHLVTLDARTWQKLSGERISAAELVRRSFEFLLQREPKESILAEFDLPLIARYFPEYEGEMKRQTGG